jgi:hypothetical protein
MLSGKEIETQFIEKHVKKKHVFEFYIVNVDNYLLVKNCIAVSNKAVLK